MANFAEKTSNQWKILTKKFKKKETIYIIQIMILLLCSLYYYKKITLNFPATYNNHSGGNLKLAQKILEAFFIRSRI